MPEHIEVILRSITSFSLLLVGTKILGKQTISQMTMFDFVATISLGAIAANLAFNTSIKVHHTIIAFTIYIAIIFLMALISLKNSKGRKFLAGDPTIVMQNGKILEGNMNKMRYTLDYLNQQLRERDIFNIEEVLFAIVETNGTLTVLKKPQFRNVTKQDLMIPVMPEQKLPIELIMDGEIIKENLKQNNITFSWLESELIKRNLLKHDVVYAVLAANGNLYVDTFRDHIHSPIDKE
ncbi:DUF421 domain-containing protein [Peribacillus frigoritolerans]|uniref:DUF421 domain-containing protein n=1 Tax=Peribacillus frigoritolerans TaxID=450367 RepID=UPI000BED97CA|nr:DUF421 domain-containing protein [Peribacillus frigoritolerans]MBD8135222.1 DUF421 domain-containing protein [Bacillus sp. CFBP 13597]PEF41004.1 hypothetical protein CON84_03305 [Bacillus sp. AFS094228]MCR8867795.1 DUF421 domain-containing protein [Peribacillus frigoritolerans]MED3833543.1 DUF421 domain-containing protein [Peribacillus frigoritolerans]MED3844879.1 DUF421 domain-containing protein [Peribacillus frigoritolerans]